MIPTEECSLAHRFKKDFPKEVIWAEGGKWKKKEEGNNNSVSSCCFKRQYRIIV